MYNFFSTLLLTVCFCASAKSQTIIKGNFLSSPSVNYQVVYNQSVINDYAGQLLDTGSTDKDGEFISSFLLDKEQPVLFFTGNRFFRVWAIPGTTLTIKETGNNQFAFSGASSKQNTFLYQSGIMMPVMVPASAITKGFEPQKQSAYLDSIENKRWALYNSSFGKTAVSQSFASFCKGEIIHFSFEHKNQYVLQHIYGASKIKQEDIPPGYFSFYEQFKLMDDSCASETYRVSLSDYTGYLASRQLGLFNNIPDKEKYHQAEFRIIDSLITGHPYTKERLLGEKLIFMMKYFDLPALADSELKIYEDRFPGSAYVAAAQKRWAQKNKNAFTRPTFVLKDIAGKKFDIQSLQGKVVYIDFWGGWCKACLEEIPNSAKLQQMFKGKDVAFLFIDFYDTQQKWLSTIKMRNIKGIHVKAEKENHLFFKESFGIDEMGFPRYALLDKNGRLVSASAPRPGDADAVSLIEKYLNE